MKPKTNILVVEPSNIIRAGIEELLDEDEFVLLAPLRDVPADFSSRLTRLQPDILLLNPTLLPSPVKPVVLCDVGANADCKPEYLVQFAEMASIYARKIIGIENPRVGLLNIGEEEEKGSQFAQEAHQLLKKEVGNFAGNAEGRDVLGGEFDVIVCDGFTGNVCLKTIEGTAKVLFKELKSIMMSSLKTKIGALMIKGDLKGLAARLDPDEAGGAPLLGVKGACIVGHGSSSAVAIKNGVLASARYVRSGVGDEIADLAK